MLKELRLYPRVPVNSLVCLKLPNEEAKDSGSRTPPGKNGKDGKGEAGGNDGSMEVPLKNVSPTGMQIECDQELVNFLGHRKSRAGLYPPVDVAFDLPMPRSTESPSTKAPTIEASCRIQYCRRIHQDGYQLGLTFLDMSEDDRDYVLRFVNSRNSELRRENNEDNNGDTRV